MQILHTTSFMNHDFTSDAHIFSATPIGRDTVSDLLYAQLVAEAKWLNEFPVFAFVTSGAELKHFAPLYEGVRLVYPEDWSLIDNADAFLVNKQMYNLCRMDDAPFVQLKHSTAEELLRLFETEMFVVAAVESTDGTDPARGQRSDASVGAP